MTATQLADKIASAKKCAGDIIYKAVLEEKKGNVLQSNSYRNSYETIKILIQSMQLYNFDYEVNQLTILQLTAIAEQATLTCVCYKTITDL